MDLTRFSDEEKDLAKAQIKRYKEIRSLVQQGDMYRLVSPFAGHEAAWMFVSEDRSEALAYYFQSISGAECAAA